MLKGTAITVSLQEPPSYYYRYDDSGGMATKYTFTFEKVIVKFGLATQQEASIKLWVRSLSNDRQVLLTPTSVKAEGVATILEGNKWSGGIVMYPSAINGLAIEFVTKGGESIAYIPLLSGDIVNANSYHIPW